MRRLGSGAAELVWWSSLLWTPVSQLRSLATFNWICRMSLATGFASATKEFSKPPKVGPEWRRAEVMALDYDSQAAILGSPQACLLESTWDVLSCWATGGLSIVWNRPPSSSS